MAGHGFSQEQKQVQHQIFAPQLRQSLNILQAPAFELKNIILEELQTNPVLEETPLEDGIRLEELSHSNENSPEKSNENEEVEFKEDFEVLKKLDEEWQEYFEQDYYNHVHTTEDAKKRQHLIDSIVSKKSLQDHLMEQAVLSELTPTQLQAIEFLIGSLDNKGFISQSLESIAEQSKLPLETIKEASDKLKAFEPTGIGCKNIQESLIVQLEAQPANNSLALLIVKDHYELFLRRRIPEIAKRTETSLENVQEALNLISTLNPAPGRDFTDDNNQVVLPDLFIEKIGNKWTIILNKEYIPRLRLSKAYKEMMAKESLAKKEREYIRDKIRSGKFIINAIAQRQETLERIAEKLIELQKDFFEHGPSALRPLTMHEVGDSLKLHETTISRAISNKFVATPHGAFPLKYFFSFGFESKDGESISNRTIKSLIAKIIQSESPQKPYSDQKIVELLAKKNIDIARRTVAKYREELGILATNLRKKY